MRKRLYPRADHPDVAQPELTWRPCCRDRGKYADAEPLFRETRWTCTAGNIPRADHPAVASSLEQPGTVTSNLQGKYAEAEAAYPGSAEDMPPALPQGATTPNWLRPEQPGRRAHGSGEVRGRRAALPRRPGDAPAAVPQGRPRARSRQPDNLAWLNYHRGKFADAEPLCRDALEMRQRLYPKRRPPPRRPSLNGLAPCSGPGKYAEAEPLYREALAMCQRLYQAGPPRPGAA